jgi:hypothetical protein
MMKLYKQSTKWSRECRGERTSGGYCFLCRTTKGDSMTVSQLQQVMGKTVFYVHKGMKFKVAIIDVRTVYGKVQYQILPIDGQGKVWVDSGSVIV